MQHDLRGKRFVVTGAGGGIGRATALMLAESGAASILCTDLDADGLAGTAKLIREQTPSVRVSTEQLDSTDEEAASAVLTAAASVGDGHFDALVNVAGISVATPLASGSLAQLERVFRVNVGSVLVMTNAILPLLADGAVIVNVNSSSAQKVTPGLGLYGASKAANLYLTRAFAVELAERGIRVCGIGPGAVDTAMPRSMLPPGEEGERLLQAAVDQAQLIKRLARPAEIADGIGFLLSDAGAFITGSNLCMDGGGTV